MAWRTTEQDVRAIIDTDASLSIAPFIDAATSLTDYVSSKDSDSLLSSTTLEQIEKWLAAHFYAHRDQQYATKKTGQASATFQGKTDMGLNSTQWGQTAKTLDVTGTLRQLDSGRKASLAWLGLPPSEQTNYEDRD